jgi:class 3 adenylate cyclase/tetratricopeptide (TPR) repeat protein
MPCQRCGSENPPEFRFCGSCGASLTVREELGRDVERKIVSALFCDVVGVTQRASVLDPEDVHRMLGAYYASARRDLERHGGTVEKFVGDAICALFGAPRTRGDDAERAVRAALAVRDSVADLNEADPELDLQIRLGIATGEALVDLRARPSEGEHLAWGDVLNTASRLKDAAPADTINVDETTYRATRHVIEYGVAEPVQAKGKVEPVLVWQALERRARPGLDPLRAGREPLVDRLEELTTLLDTLDRVGRDRTPELVTVVGEPGIGRSRLVFELARRVELLEEIITWRQGRSPPYGEGFSFWALGEIVKGQAGILETDGASAASAKLARAVHDLVPAQADAARIEAHLQSLVGLGADLHTTHGDQREAAFSAWRHFLEALARQRPLVLVFEDVQWADDGLLDFVEHVLEWGRDVPVLIVCTARPELFDRRPGWAARDNARSLVLRPLSQGEAGELVAELAGEAIPSETATAIVAAAAGNPLFTVELVRMLEDRGLLAASDRSLGAAGDQTLPVPQSVQSIIAARLDSLSDERKALLQDAAVVGKVVWPGALAAIGGRSRRAVDRDLRELERRELLTRARLSSVEREPEYRFRHTLVRDVAYSQIARRRRGESHRRTAEWLETLRPDRASDLAELLAHHYLSAYELARASEAETVELSERARIALRDAGDRALSLQSFPIAAKYFRAALELWPGHDPERPELLLRLGKSLYYADTAGAEVLIEAEEGLLRAGDRESAAEAATFLADLAHQLGQPQETVFEHARRALALVEGVGPSRAKVDVLVDLALFLGLGGEHEQAIGLAEEALQDAEALELQELQARALATMGISRGLSGDPRGRADLQRSIAITEEIDSSLGSHHCGMLADLEFNLGNLDECFELQARARRHAERFGHAAHIQWLRAEQVAEGYWTGRWDEALSLAEEFVGETESGTRHFMEGYCRTMRGRICLARGDVAGASEDADVALQQARASNEPQMLYPALAFRAHVLAEVNAGDEAARLADELLALWTSKLTVFPASSWLVDLSYALERLERPDDLLLAAEGVTARTPWLEAAVAFSRGDFPVAAEFFRRIGSRPDEALSHLRAAEQFVRAGNEGDGRASLELALSFYRGVDASAYIGQAEALPVA